MDPLFCNFVRPQEGWFWEKVLIFLVLNWSWLMIFFVWCSVKLSATWSPHRTSTRHVCPPKHIPVHFNAHSFIPSVCIRTCPTHPCRLSVSMQSIIEGPSSISMSTSMVCKDDELNDHSLYANEGGKLLGGKGGWWSCSARHNSTPTLHPPCTYAHEWMITTAVHAQRRYTCRRVWVYVRNRLYTECKQIDFFAYIYIHTYIAHHFIPIYDRQQMVLCVLPPVL